jgi:hypothetical protein
VDRAGFEPTASCYLVCKVQGKRYQIKNKYTLLIFR